MVSQSGLHCLGSLLKATSLLASLEEVTAGVKCLDILPSLPQRWDTFSSTFTLSHLTQGQSLTKGIDHPGRLLMATVGFRPDLHI